MKSLKNSAATFFILFMFSVAVAAENPNLQIYQQQAEFSEVRQNLIDAVIGRGFALDYNGRIGDMLKRTRDDVGGKPLYREAEYLLFCSAVLSRRMMEADRQNIGFCPFIITVYEKESDPGTIYVSYRKLTQTGNADPALLAIEIMYDEIAREAVE